MADPRYTDGDGDGWISTAVSGNTLTVTVEVNAAATARSGRVVLRPIRGTLYGTPVSLPVSQAGTASGLIVEPVLA